MRNYYENQIKELDIRIQKCCYNCKKSRPFETHTCGRMLMCMDYLLEIYDHNHCNNYETIYEQKNML